MNNIQSTFRDMRRIKDKLKKTLELSLNKNIVIDKTDELSKDELLILMESGAVQLHMFRISYIKEKFTEEIILAALKYSLTNVQHLTNKMYTKEIIKYILRNDNNQYFQNITRLDLIENEDFDIFLDNNYFDFENIISKINSYYFVEDKKIETYKYNQENQDLYNYLKSSKKEIARLYKIILLKDNSFNLLNNIKHIEEYKEFFINFIEKNLEKLTKYDNLFLSKIPHSVQSRNIITTALKKDINNINYANISFLKNKDIENWLKKIISDRDTNISDLSNKINFFKHVLTKKIVTDMFIYNKEAFFNISYYINKDYLSDNMITELFKYSISNYINEDMEHIIKSKLKEEQLKILIENIGKSKIKKVLYLIPDELIEKFELDKKDYHETILKEGGHIFFEIPKSQQTSILFNISLNNKINRLSKSDIILNIKKIKIDLLNIEEIRSSIVHNHSDITFVEEYLLPYINNYTINKEMSKYSDLWKYLNPKYLNDEKIILNMLFIENSTTENVEEFIQNKINNRKKNNIKKR